MSELKVGQKAPAFTLESHTGNKVSLSELKGKMVVLYFYPKDSTPGCTTEACDFRDAKSVLGKKNAVVLGVSKDSLASHVKFAENQKLNFELLSDPDGKVCEKYGVWQEKKNYGKTYMGIVRSTFVIDTEGKIKSAWYGVKVKGHLDQVLEAL